MTPLEIINSQRPEELRSRSQESLEWFRQNLRSIRMSSGAIQETFRKSYQAKYASRVELGRIYMYMYDAKWKEKLPYWDRFPLVIPFRRANRGFYGVNLHYIQPLHRALLMQEVYENFLSNDNFDDETLIRIRYATIMSVTRLKYARPCIKRYLTNHIDSRIIDVPIDQWDMVAMIPSQQFNVNANSVYKDSRAKYG
jgi:hypothetical protein